jgi:phospholipid transport system transporter-binding protein
MLILPPSLTIAEVGALKGSLDALLAGAAPLTLDGRGVTRADTAGVQLLLAFAREAEARGRRFTWAGFSSTLAEVARRLDLARDLGLDAKA